MGKIICKTVNIILQIRRFSEGGKKNKKAGRFLKTEMWWWEKAQDDKSRWWNDILELPTQRQHSHLSIIWPSEAKQTAAQDINIPIPTYVTECILWRS